MFRPYGLPLIKGAGTPSSPTPQPIPARVHGLGGITAVEGQRLANLYAGAVRQFVHGQRQMYALSTPENMRVVREVRPGVVVTYMVRQGAEHVDVLFKPELVQAAYPSREKRTVLDTLLMGSIDVTVGTSGHSYGTFGGGPASPETAFTGKVVIGETMYTETATASFQRGVRLVMFVFSSWEEMLWFEPDNPSPTNPGAIIPDNGAPIWPVPAAAGVVNSIFPRTPTAGEEIVEGYTGPWRPISDISPNPETGHTFTKYMRVLAKDVGIDLFGEVALSTIGTAYGQRQIFAPGGGVYDDWPVISSCLAVFYPRGASFYRPYVRTWRGWSSPVEDRMAVIQTVTYTGTNTQTVLAGSPSAAKYTINLKSTLTTEDMVQSELPNYYHVEV